MDDLKTLQPTVFPVVPRLLNRMYDKVSSPKTVFNPYFPSYPLQIQESMGEFSIMCLCWLLLPDPPTT